MLVGTVDRGVHTDGPVDLADRVQELYLDGRKDDAVAAIPDELVDALHIVGDEAKVRDRVAEWEDAGVTTVLLSLTEPDAVRRVADLLA